MASWQKGRRDGKRYLKKSKKWSSIVSPYLYILHNIA